VPTVSLHVHERIDPRTIIETVRKKNGVQLQASLFQFDGENPPIREAVEFYKHKHNWSNRLVAGDSLLVMNSLIEKEGMAGKVQMVYIDPPYGIKYGSNFQPFVNKRDVKDGKDADLTVEPEMIKAFRDTWELGIHSYLTYLRDRLLLARDLLTESGSIFVQISDENLHHVKELLDEIFSPKHFVSIISVTKTTAMGARLLPRENDYIVWYAKNIETVKYRQLFTEKDPIKSGFTRVKLSDGNIRSINEEEKRSLTNLPKGAKLVTTGDLTKPGPGSKFDVEYEGKIFTSGNRWWGTPKEGIEELIRQNRISSSENMIYFLRQYDDYPVQWISNVWTDTSGIDGKLYVVQTNSKIIERCMLMCTDPGDIALDPTCGSGTTAFVAEKWGRRWITCDTSRIAIALAKQRIMTQLYDYYKLAYPNEGVGSGLIYKSVPHITIANVANKEPPATEILYDKPQIDKQKVRVTGPFTVEAVPSPSVKPIDDYKPDIPADAAVAREGETLRQTE
ncbi:MAG: site-specific DNA-methyltransferase, partial [Thermoplasmata archaeon]|nr:site-specific DNA-methyltransferase [Thermoplasmata archaeon]